MALRIRDKIISILLMFSLMCFLVPFSSVSLTFADEDAPKKVLEVDADADGNEPDEVGNGAADMPIDDGAERAVMASGVDEAVDTGNDKANSGKPEDNEQATTFTQGAEVSIAAADPGKTFASLEADSAATATNLVLVVEFKDSPAASGYSQKYLDGSVIPTYWERLIREMNGLEPDGSDSYVRSSYRKYFNTISNGKTNIKSYFPQTYTDGSFMRIRSKMTAYEYASGYKYKDYDLIDEVIAALNEARPDLDVSLFDKDSRNSGCIDNLLIIVDFEGVDLQGADFASHASSSVSLGNISRKVGVANGTKQIDKYTIVNGGVPAKVAGSGTMDSFNSSVAAHERLHTLGARDYYRESGKGMPVDIWDIMAAGSRYSWPLATTRQIVGWNSIRTVRSNDLAESYTLYSPSTAYASGGTKEQALIIKTPKSESEYFVVEYRRCKASYPYSGFDDAIGGSGLIVYKVNDAIDNKTNFNGEDYIYVYRPDATSVSAADGDVMRAPITAGSYKRQGSRTFFSSIGSPERNATIADRALCYGNGNGSGTNSGLVIKATAQDDDSITFTIEMADDPDGLGWDPVTSHNSSTPFTPMLGLSPSMTGDGTNLYVASTSITETKSYVYKYDGVNWTTLEDSVDDMRNIDLAWVDGELYAFGISSTSSNVMLMRYTGSGWEEAGSISANAPSHLTCMGVVGGKIYALVDSNGSDLRLYQFNGSGFSSLGKTLPITAPTASALAEINGSVAVISGDYGDLNNVFTSPKTTSVYTLSGSMWNERPLISNGAASSISVAAYNGKTYVYTGTNAGLDSQAKLFCFAPNGALESESNVAQAANAVRGVVLTPGIENLYLTTSGTDGINVYALKGGSASEVTQLGGQVYTGDSGVAAYAMGDDMYLSIPDNATKTLTVRTHGLAPNDTAAVDEDTRTHIGDVEISGIAGERKTYTGGEIRLDNSIKLYDTISNEATGNVPVKYQLIEDTDYKLSYSNNTNAGTATVTITGIGNYKGTTSETFTIARAKAGTSTAVSGLVYNGKSQRGVNVGSGCTAKDISATKAGTHKATITPDSNHCWADGTMGSIMLSYTIAPADISKATVSSISDQKWTGKAITPSPMVTLNGKVLVKDTDYTVSWGNNINAGTGTVTISGKGNYAGIKTASFKIVKNATNSGSSAGSGSGSGSGSATKPSTGSGSGSGSGSAIKPSATPSVTGVSMYRMYNPNSGEHFYTANAAERDMLRGVGWRYEGIGWTAPSSGADVYRLYNPNAGDHHYTPNGAERDMLVRVGWRYEGVGWKSGGSVPLYRQYNPNAVTGTHNYTTNKAENDMLVRVGWRGEGIGWYGLG